HVDDMHSRGWAPWLDLPQDLKSGRVSARAWLEFDAGRIRYFTSDVSVLHGHWSLENKVQASANFLRLFVAGPWDAFDGLLPSSTPAAAGESGSMPALEYSIATRGLGVRAAALVEHSLYLAQIDMPGVLQPRGVAGQRVQAQHLAILNKDMDASLQGTWEAGGIGAAGVADVRG